MACEDVTPHLVPKYTWLTRDLRRPLGQGAIGWVDIDIHGRSFDVKTRAMTTTEVGPEDVIGAGEDSER